MQNPTHHRNRSQLHWGLYRLRRAMQNLKQALSTEADSLWLYLAVPVDSVAPAVIRTKTSRRRTCPTFDLKLIPAATSTPMPCSSQRLNQLHSHRHRHKHRHHCHRHARAMIPVWRPSRFHCPPRRPSPEEVELRQPRMQLQLGRTLHPSLLL